MDLTAEPRRAAPLSVKLQVALSQLEAMMRETGRIPEGCNVVGFDLDHDPALGLRDINPETGEHIPHQHDPRFLVWRPKVEHSAKTTGRRGESKLSRRGGDVTEIAKLKRIRRKEEDFRRRVLSQERGERGPEIKKPKQKIRSRNDLRKRERKK